MPVRSAAIFDLDRTLLVGSSTPVLNEVLFEAGLVSRPGLPGQGLAMRIYDRFGETFPSMALARSAALMAKGWSRKEVVGAAEAAADRLERLVAPWACELLDWHRSAGRELVLATTTPRDMVAPLARRLGIDHVVGTGYASEEGTDGVERYTGSLDGHFVWALGKLAAVRSWAADAGVDLSSSWAYSDSVYDVPLLSAVGHPVAVNADARLLPLAYARRWKVMSLDCPPSVPKVLGAEPLDAVRLLVQPWSFPFARFDIAGTENIPRRGPAIVAANHRSYFDTVAYGMAVFQAGRNPRGLAKKELFDAPVIGQLMRAAGAICVDRHGAGGGGAYEAAEAALCCGEVLIIAPQGTIPRGEDFFDPHLRGKSGAARLAASTGAPVVPLGVWGSEAVWPRSSRVPLVGKVIRPPVVRVRVGPPVKGLTGTDFEADTERIMSAIVELLPPEAKLPRIPTADELARTKPPS